MKLRSGVRPRTHVLWWAVPALVLLASPLRAPAAGPLPDKDCLDCHADPDLTRTVDGKDVPLPPIPTNKLAKSVHGSLSCVDCHGGITNLPHDSKQSPARCGDCHEAPAKAYASSIHGVSHQMGGTAAAGCADCHGTHDILAAKNADSPVFKLNLPQTCARCHSNTNLSEEYQVRAPNAAAQYLESIHGRGLMKMGLIVAPSCNDCHGIHDIVPAVYTNSPVNHRNISRTCGKCHVGIEEIYNASVHGQLLLQGDKNGPTCTECHSAHSIETPEGSGHFKALSDQRCGRCHEDRLEHYRDTYHGKAMALGRPNVASSVAACYDCHGHHDVFPHTDPRSMLSTNRIVGTCQTCHPKAGPKFAEFKPHANPLDKKNYPALHGTFIFMTSLLIGVFAFFGAHTLFWLARSAQIFFRDSAKFHEIRLKTQADDEWFTRFAPYERFLHILVVTSFLLLVLTGMPLKFYYTDWAKVLFGLLGGPEVARSLHHFGALVTFLYFALHLGSLAVKAWARRGVLRDPATGRLSGRRLGAVVLGPDSMVPTAQDWRDFVAHQKWFFSGGPRPQFDRWTYWEKFDYLAVFWGVFAIGMSGLILWFPEEATRFLPGWTINIAHIVHSDEALLAAGFIFTVHFFNTHFRLEKFPMDTVIFSGRISKAELLHERKRWYDRLAAVGRLDQYRVKDEWIRWQSIARPFGYLFFGTGLVLLVLIVYAMATRLAH